MVDCSPEIGFLQTDLTKFRQCLVNLVGNAAKFTEDGVITIRVQERLVEAQEWIDLQVSDTGVGMSPQQMDRLFESFSQGDSTTTRQYGGTGLGLAISRRFSRLLGGDISVTSTQGEGSTFTLSLPRQLSDPSADHSGPPTLSSGDRLGPQGPGLPPHGTVLVIDDDPAILDLASRHLERQGYQVAVAFNAEQGLSLARQLLPDLILLDLLMPGLNGMECLDQLENNPSLHAIPVIVVTAMDLSAKELRALQGRVRAVVRKSGEGHDLAEQINAILAST
ncbi:MAG: ATP-binding protein [Cyanobacteriota bacterium]|nr:ATP-binding protein [Cyanobacteriota bacterium]